MTISMHEINRGQIQMEMDIMKDKSDKSVRVRPKSDAAMNQAFITAKERQVHKSDLTQRVGV
jgi:hypothetical protein